MIVLHGALPLLFDLQRIRTELFDGSRSPHTSFPSHTLLPPLLLRLPSSRVPERRLDFRRSLLRGRSTAHPSVLRSTPSGPHPRSFYHVTSPTSSRWAARATAARGLHYARGVSVKTARDAKWWIRRHLGWRI